MTTGTLATVSDDQASRFTTRQLLPPTLVFLAALFATVAITAPTLLAPQLARVSLDTNLVAIAPSTEPAVTLDRCSLDGPRAVLTPPTTLIRNQRIVVVRPADRRIATVQAGTAIRRDDKAPGCSDPVLFATLDRVTVDRTTAAPTGESSVQTDSRRPAWVLPDRSGFTYLFAPRFTPDSAQRFFDPVTRQHAPLTVLGRDIRDGRAVTRMRAEIPDTDLAALPGADPRMRLTRPAAWFGRPGADMTADVWQGGRYTLWVDEASGLVVDAEIVVRRDYRAGDLRLPDVEATFRYDEQTRKSLVDAARTQSRPAWLAGRIVPIVAVIAALAAAGGAWTLRRRSRDAA